MLMQNFNVHVFYMPMMYDRWGGGSHSPQLSVIFFQNTNKRDGEKLIENAGG